MSGYDVRAAIREVVESSDLSDPADIAEKVVANVPAKVLRDVLAQVLPQYVRVYIKTMPSWREPDEDQPKANRSAKVAAYQQDASRWRRMLRKPVAVEGYVWKQFGECTTEDLVFLAADRRENAAESIAAAVRFEKYSAALDEAGADTVADLPDAVIASIEDTA